MQGAQALDGASPSAYAGSVAICYRIAGHVKHPAKEVAERNPRSPAVRGFFVRDRSEGE